MGNTGGVDDALKKHKNIGSTSEPVVNVDERDDEPPPLVERVSALPYDADSPAPWGIRFVCAKHKLMKFVPRVNRPGKRCERFGGNHGFDYGPDFSETATSPWHGDLLVWLLGPVGKSRGKPWKPPWLSIGESSCCNNSYVG